MDPIADYLQSDILPTDPDQAHRLKRIATRYCLVDRYLYRKGKSLPLLRFLHPNDACWALDEVHSGDCGNHASGETLAYQILRMSYFLAEYTSGCKAVCTVLKACKKTVILYHLPPKRLSSISTPYPFAIWGLDLIELLSTAPDQVKHVVVAIDYFT